MRVMANVADRRRRGVRGDHHDQVLSRPAPAQSRTAHAIAGFGFGFGDSANTISAAITQSAPAMKKAGR